MDRVGVSYWVFRPAHAPDKCLDITGGNSAVHNGAKAQQFQCLPNQLNQLCTRRTYDGGDTWVIGAVHSGKVLDVEGGLGSRYTDGALIQRWTFYGERTTNQRWNISG